MPPLSYTQVSSSSIGGGKGLLTVGGRHLVQDRAKLDLIVLELLYLLPQPLATSHFEALLGHLQRWAPRGGSNA